MANATRKAALKVSENWTPEVFSCRVSGHKWRKHSLISNLKVGFVQITWKCEDCGSHRHQDMNRRTGTVYATRIDYTPGYLAFGVGKIQGIAKDAIRKVHVSTLFDNENESE